MTPVDLIKGACAEPLTTEDGDPVPRELQPPLSDDEIASFQKRLPCPLPDDIRALLLFCRGFTGAAADFVDFTGSDCMFEDEAAFPHGLPIAADGFGNFWVVDLSPTSTTWGPIYFACHDAPVILYQSPSLENFLSELFKMSLPPYKSLVDDVHEDRLFEVWRKNPEVMTHEECVASKDPELKAFAQKLGPSFQIIDLRDAKVGFGFSCGRYGPKTVGRRHGTAPIFAYQRRKGLRGRILGGPTT